MYRGPDVHRIVDLILNAVNSQNPLSNMSLAKTIKSLENQNLKLKKLLECTLQLVGDDAEKMARLEAESRHLKSAVEELETRKLQLLEELESYVAEQPPEPSERTLEDALEHIRTESLQLLNIEDERLLEEKQQLIEEIALIRSAVEQDGELTEKRSRLERELAVSIRQSSSLTGREVVDRMTGVETMKSELLNELEKSKTSLPLSVPTENAVIEVKISSLEKRRDVLLQELRSILLESAEEVSKLHGVTRDGRLKHLINEVEIRKAALIVNTMKLKESDTRVSNATGDKTSDTGLEESLERPGSHLEGARVTLSTVSEEEEAVVNVRAEPQVLNEDVERLERERQGLLHQLQAPEAAVPSGGPREDASRLLEEEILTVRVEELELVNRKTKFELDGLLVEMERVGSAENASGEDSDDVLHVQ